MQNRHMRRPLAFAVSFAAAAAAAAALAAGGGAAPTSAQGARAGKTPVAFLIATTSAGYTRGVLAAAQKQAAASNVSLTVFDAQFNPQKQFAQCQDAISSHKFKAIILLAAASPPMVPCAKLAKQAHIPLIATNVPVGSDLSHYQPLVPGVTSQVLVPGTVAYQALKAPLAAACKLKGGGKNCHVGFIIGVKVLALSSAAEKLVGQYTKGMTYVGSGEGGYQRQGGLKVMQDLLQKDPQLNILVSMSDDMALGAELAMKAVGKTPGKDILVLTQGGSYPDVTEIRAGRWYATTVSNATTEGAIPVKLAAKAASGGTVPRFVDSTKAGGTPQIINKAWLDAHKSFKGTFPA